MSPTYIAYTNVALLRRIHEYNGNHRCPHRLIGSGAVEYTGDSTAATALTGVGLTVTYY